MNAICCSIKEATLACGLSRATIYNLLDSGQLESVKVGKRRLIKIESLRELLNDVDTVCRTSCFANNVR